MDHSMSSLILSTLDTADDIEVVERKGAGHPDTICDALAETLSRNLCREYQRRFGEILHHNVDKALLCGGCAAPAFGGGQVLAPIGIYLAGRAVSEAGGERIPLKDIAVEGSLEWLKSNLHALDPARHVRIDALVRQGSQDLQALFARRSDRFVAFANDTSFGVGHAPLSALERLVLAIEKRLHARDRWQVRPAWGEDTKVMAVRSGERIEITVACAMIGRFVDNIDSYLDQKVALAAFVRGLVSEYGFPASEVNINTGDDMASGQIYLTVTGTSAEAGDDGQVGRGNRVNGLITPCRPMSLEAAAGKNPVSHVGKIYNVLAKDIAETLVSTVAEISAAQCLMVSRIGAPVSMPALTRIKLATRDGIPVVDVRPRVEEIVAGRIECIPKLIDGFVAGSIGVY